MQLFCIVDRYAVMLHNIRGGVKVSKHQLRITHIMKNTTIYYAIIGDIKSSKEIDARYEAQEKLRAILKSVNQLYQGDIAANFIITLGDEFQGLLHDAEHLLGIVKYIQRKMYPIEIRFGIGIGEMFTAIDHESALGADGPAYYAARNTIITIHNQEKKIKKQAADIQIGFYNKTCFEVEEINAMLSLIKVIEDSWSEKQRYTIWDRIENSGSQEMSAMRLNTSQSTIARRLADGKYIVYQNAMSIIGEALRRVKFNID